MKLKHLIVSCLAICGLLTSCLSEPEFEPVIEGGIPINLDGAISQVATKVTAQGFEHKDALGLYAVNYENSNQTPGVLLDDGNQADHVKYIYDGVNSKWNPVRPVYYKDINTNVDLYAFYPYAEPSSVSSYMFEVQKDQSSAETDSKLSGYEASDFLWSKVENIAPTESAIKMTLNHKLAGVHVILKEGSGFEQAGDFTLIDKNVLLTNTNRKASINLANGEVTPIGDAQSTGIIMCPQTDGTFRSIAIPQIVKAGTPLFSITIEGIAYSFSKNVDCEYVAGKLSTFTITINRKQHSGEYELILSDTQIVDWKEDLNTHEGEARQYYCVSCDKPGSLGKLIRADKKNPKKIKNLKISGKISDEDFYFMRDSMDIIEAINLNECKIVDVVMSEYKLLNHDNSEILVSRSSGTYNDIIPHQAFANKKSLQHFVFPEEVVEIGREAFAKTLLNGNLVLPDMVEHIHDEAFKSTYITNVSLSTQLATIGKNAFYGTKLSGELSLPNNLIYIGASAFNKNNFYGRLELPQSLQYIGSHAFDSAGDFVGDLTIPENVKVIPDYAFCGSGFTGRLNLNNVIELKPHCFHACNFTGELIIPEGVIEIPTYAFQADAGEGCLSSLILPSSLRIIGETSFQGHRFETITIPEGVISIGNSAFYASKDLIELSLPKSIQYIDGSAFSGCNNISKMSVGASTPPNILSSTFNGVPKDNFTLEVPANAIAKYSTDPIWGQFRRISAHYDFAISRNRSRALNAGISKKYILRAPANYSWSIESKPEWITVSPSSGTGKTEVTITFSEMTSADASQISVEMTHPTYAYQTTTKKLNGRAGEITFLLDDKDYRTTMTVEQFDYVYGDGDVIVLNEATKGDGVNLVFLGDCYDAADIAAGNYLADLEEAVGYYFALEPYKTYKDYFNVYAVLGVSDDSGMGTLNTIKDAKFGSTFGEKNLVQPDMNICFEYACKAPINDNIAKTLVVLVENTTEYGGVCYMYGDGSAVACCPKSADAYPYDFRGIVQHEAGGHGFGKLGDEYIYHNAFISTCICTDGCGHERDLLVNKNRGWYRNLELTGDMNEVGWSHFIFHPKYSNVVDIYEGGYFHTRGVYRSEPTSCMNNNIPYYSAISRQAMVERIMEYAGETFNLEEFIAKDVTTAGPTTKAGLDVLPVETFYDNGKQHAPVYMGDKPDFKK